MTKPALASQAWLVFAGDSRTDPTGDVGPGTTGTWPYQLRQMCPYLAAPTAQGNVYNFAQDGATTATILAQFSNNQLDANTGYPVLYFIWIGVNDMGQNRSASAIYTDLKSIWSQARGLGYHVVAFTVGPTMSGAADSALIAINKLILSDTTLYDLLIQPESILPMTPNLDTHAAWFCATIHPSNAGNARIAQAIAAALDP